MCTGTPKPLSTCCQDYITPLARTLFEMVNLAYQHGAIGGGPKTVLTLFLLTGRYFSTESLHPCPTYGVSLVLSACMSLSIMRA